MTPEGRVKADIKKWLDARGFWRAGAPEPKGQVRGWYYMPVNNGMGVSGIPDFLGAIVTDQGTTIPFGIEAKAPGSAPTARQLDRHAEMRRGGFHILVCDDVSTLTDFEEFYRG